VQVVTKLESLFGTSMLSNYKPKLADLIENAIQLKRLSLAAANKPIVLAAPSPAPPSPDNEALYPPLLFVGNTCKAMGNGTFAWTVFVSPLQASIAAAPFIETVRFQLHPSFNPSNVLVYADHSMCH
jgi:hypothetical protein